MMTSHSNGSTAPTRIFLLVTAMAAVSCSVGTCSAQETLATVRAVQQFGAPIQSGANKSERKSARDARGFLFLEGEYVPPPYDVSATDDDVQVNGRSISDLLTGFRPSATRKRPLAGSTAAWAARRLQKDLDSGLIVVLFPGQPAKSSRLDSTADQFYELLLATDESQTVSAVDELCNRLAEGTDVALWRSWLTDYTPPAELTNRLRIYRETVDAIGLANESPEQLGEETPFLRVSVNDFGDGTLGVLHWSSTSKSGDGRLFERDRCISTSDILCHTLADPCPRIVRPGFGVDDSRLTSWPDARVESAGKPLDQQSARSADIQGRDHLRRRRIAVWAKTLSSGASGEPGGLA